MSKKQRERVEDEANFHKQRLNEMSAGHSVTDDKPRDNNNHHDSDAVDQLMRYERGLWDVVKIPTRHKASTSMYSLTFCIRIVLPERQQWKPAVQTALVMLRMSPLDG